MTSRKSQNGLWLLEIQKILPSVTVKNICACLDTKLTMADHVDSIIRSYSCQMCLLSCIQKHMSQEAVMKVCRAFITFRIDNINSLLFNMPDYQHHRLQLILHNIARLNKKPGKTGSVSAVLKELHWLPIPQRIEYKILLLVYKCVTEQAPLNLIRMFFGKKPSGQGNQWFSGTAIGHQAWQRSWETDFQCLQTKIVKLVQLSKVDLFKAAYKRTYSLKYTYLAVTIIILLCFLVLHIELRGNVSFNTQLLFFISLFVRVLWRNLKCVLMTTCVSCE